MKNFIIISEKAKLLINHGKPLLAKLIFSENLSQDITILLKNNEHKTIYTVIFISFDEINNLLDQRITGIINDMKLT